MMDLRVRWLTVALALAILASASLLRAEPGRSNMPSRRRSRTVPTPHRRQRIEAAQALTEQRAPPGCAGDAAGGYTETNNR